MFPYVDIVSEWFDELYQLIIPWIGKNVLGLKEEITAFTNGSGDTTYDYVLILFYFVLSVLIGGTWAFLTRKRSISPKWNYWLLVGTRYFLGIMMISYGMIKVIQLQFSEPSFSRLLQPIGETSPMGLAWTFVGYSNGYNIFIGLGEVIGGILLFHRRTTLLGTLILIPVTANIVAMNMFYDIPVKIFSSELLLMCFVILAPHFKQFVIFTLGSGSTSPTETFSPFTSKKWKIGGGIIKWGFVVFVLYSSISETYEGYYEYGSGASKTPLYGLYETDHFIKNGDTLTPILGESQYWRYIIFEYEETMSVSKLDDTMEWFKAAVNEDKQTIKLKSYRDSTNAGLLNYEQTDNTFTLSGVLNGDTIDLQLSPKKKRDFELMGRGFHWVNEFPRNY